MKALFVDLDGTLADTVPKLYSIYCELLLPYGVEGSAEEFKLLNGHTLKEIVAYLKTRNTLPVEEAILLKRYEESVELLYSDIPLFPSAKETLETMQARGVRVFLVTSASAKLANHFTAAHKLHFEGIVTAEGIPGKPAPDIYQKALHLAKVPPEAAVAIEDSPNGIKAAQEAGIHVFDFLQLKTWENIRQELDGLSDV